MFDIALAEHLAEISMLKFTKSQLLNITEDMARIIELIDTVAEFKEDIKITAAGTPAGLDDLRQDAAEQPLSPGELLPCAHFKDGFFKSPKVV